MLVANKKCGLSLANPLKRSEYAACLRLALLKVSNATYSLSLAGTGSCFEIIRDFFNVDLPSVMVRKELPCKLRNPNRVCSKRSFRHNQGLSWAWYSLQFSLSQGTAISTKASTWACSCDLDCSIRRRRGLRFGLDAYCILDFAKREGDG